MTIVITTNHKRRELVDFAALPVKVQHDFDYIKGDDYYSPRFINYKGVWYDTRDTQAIVVGKDHTKPMGWAMYVERGSALSAWNAVISDTYFSGVLFRFVDDDVICGRYYYTTGGDS